MCLASDAYEEGYEKFLFGTVIWVSHNKDPELNLVWSSGICQVTVSSRSSANQAWAWFPWMRGILPKSHDCSRGIPEHWNSAWVVVSDFSSYGIVDTFRCIVIFNIYRIHPGCSSCLCVPINISNVRISNVDEVRKILIKEIHKITH